MTSRATGAAEFPGGGHKGVDVFLIEIQVVFVNEGFDVVAGDGVEVRDFDFLGRVARQRIALVEPEGPVLDPQVARFFVEGVDVPVVAKDDFTHRAQAVGE